MFDNPDRYYTPREIRSREQWETDLHDARVTARHGVGRERFSYEIESAMNVCPWESEAQWWLANVSVALAWIEEYPLREGARDEIDRLRKEARR